uniref:Paraneoplastic antigen Ma-like C-terminal domain-containing protein n=1 Tax=Takifugu rubripes TaxID=31033 RepID=A0A674NRV9_TAKRU
MLKLYSVYGSVEDGDELLAKFMGTLQNNDEKPSDYLNRLQVASAVVRRGGIAEGERNRYLLKQFCRGCWNDGLIADLQLERRTSVPPSFAEVVLLVRTEEDKQASKHDRMKKHLGLHKQSPPCRVKNSHNTGWMYLQYIVLFKGEKNEMTIHT